VTFSCHSSAVIPCRVRLGRDRRLEDSCRVAQSSHRSRANATCDRNLVELDSQPEQRTHATWRRSRAGSPSIPRRFSPVERPTPALLIIRQFVGFYRTEFFPSCRRGSATHLRWRGRRTAWLSPARPEIVRRKRSWCAPVRRRGPGGNRTIGGMGPVGGAREGNRLRPFRPEVLPTRVTRPSRSWVTPSRPRVASESRVPGSASGCHAPFCPSRDERSRVGHSGAAGRVAFRRAPVYPFCSTLPPGRQLA